MITIPEKHSDVIAYNASLRDFSDSAATLARKGEALNDATQKFMAQKAAPRSKRDLEPTRFCPPVGIASTGFHWKGSKSLREVEIWERVVQRRRDTVNNLRAGYSAAICQQPDVQERYIVIQRKMARHCAGLAEGNAEEVEFFDESKQSALDHASGRCGSAQLA